jgi:hypothetical protein
MSRTRFNKVGVIGVALGTFLICSSCGEPRATAPEGTINSSTSSGPTLVECPTSQTDVAQGEIGPLGNLLNPLTLDGSSISIPPGALASPQLFLMTVPAGRFMELDISAVGFDTFLFQDSVSVTIDYSRCNRSDLANKVLHVWHIDPVTKALLDDMGGVNDAANHRITFKTNHLSGYAVAD